MVGVTAALLIEEVPSTPGLYHRASSLALNFYAIAHRLPEADQRLILAALFESSPFDQGEDVRGRAIASVRQYAEESLACGRPTSQRGYKAWRTTQPKHMEHPDLRTIVRVFGDWQSVIAEAAEGLAADLRASRLISSPRFTHERVKEVVLEFAAENPNGRLTQKACMAWAKQKSRASTSEAGRYPTSLGPFARCGGWRVLLRELGLGDRLTESPSERTRTAPPLKYSDEELLGWLRRASDETSGLGLSKVRYERFRRKLLLVEGETGVPHAALLVQRFGSWDEAKRTAGIWVSVTAPYSTEELIGFFSDAIRDLGPGVSQEHYDRWRKDEIARREASGVCEEAARVPSAHTLRNQLGDQSWTRARAFVLEAIDG